MGYDVGMLVRVLHNRDQFRGKRILTLGTLYPYVEKNKDRAYLKNNFGLDFESPHLDFSSHLFEDLCGAESCDALDVSDYQGAKIICDLNKEVPLDCLEKFDVVIDAGTLEHLFITTTALSNIFSLLKPGGMYFFAAPCNGWVDHGFVQFSPTFYRDFAYRNSGTVQCRELFLSEQTATLDLAGLTNFGLTAFVRSHKKINVNGLLEKKQSGELAFDVIQEKYRTWHASAATAKVETNFFRKLAIKLVEAISASTLVPYQLKVLLLDQIGRHRKKT